MWSFQNLLFIIIFLVLVSKGDIINNPVLVTDHANPIIFQDDNYYYIYTSGEFVKLSKTTGEKITTSLFGTYTSPYVWITDQSNNNYIFSKNAMYKVNIPNSYNSVTKPQIEYPSSYNFIGYLKETKYDSTLWIAGCLASIVQDEIIIYGKTATSKIIFSFLKKPGSYSVDLINNFPSIEDKMSCKVISNGEYICAIISNNKVYICLFAYVIKNQDENEMSLLGIYSFNNILSNHKDVSLYDMEMNSGTHKLACAINKETNHMECLHFAVNFQYVFFFTQCPSGGTVTSGSIKINFEIDPNSNGDCLLSKFAEEFLFCCPGRDLLKCARTKSDYTYISTFDLNFPGENNKINIFSDDITYSSIFFRNENSGEKLYEYYIYLPTCENLNFTIIVFHSINENKNGNEIDLNNLFLRKTNTKYYIEFEVVPDNYGDLLVNNESIILGNNSKILLEEGKSYILDYISTNDNIINNFQIPYKISIEETYSASCSINLTILPCYDSCSRCSKDKDSSSQENHNCIEDKCKTGYYPSPTTLTNCFKEEEKESNWYLDYSTMRFGLCDQNCSTCYGPSSDNCLTCYPYSTKPELSYLINNKCVNKCPEGKYQEIQNEGYYKCKNCYQNCKTCNELGNSNVMKCSSCNENNIRYNSNCYIEYDPKQKTFYKPGSNTEITSCYELLAYYIEENTYECISSMPNKGYFLANSNTGLFAKCHSECDTCSKNYTESSSNCDTCVNSEYYLLEGNCVVNCPEGYYSSVNNGINICKKCYTNCMACNTGPEYDNDYKLINMNCLTCKKEIDQNNPNNLIENKIKIESNCFPIITYTEEKITFDTSIMSTGETEKSCLDYNKSILFGEYKCIQKEINYFYVLNNDQNTGVVKKCDKACQTCFDIKNEITRDTNCINCAEGYFKTEDSNTNCILESLIPENYFKNNTDNIYYKCYKYCKKCNNYFIEENDNMNCIECINDYYFVYGTNNCYNMSYKEENDYFFSERDNKFHKCYFSCLKCTQLELDDYNHNCDECIEGFYFEYNTNNCYNMSILERGYYFDNFSINQGEAPVYKKCYENCKTCNDKMIDDNMNCILCKDDFHKINGTNNCYDDSLLEQGYYLKDNIYYPCESNCKTCSNSKTITNDIISYNCLSCDFITKILYLVQDLNNCEPESFKENGYYLKEKEDEPDILIFYKCYQSCSLCDKGKEFDTMTNKDNHNCLQCKDNYYPLKNDPNPKNCYNEDEMVPNGYNLIRNYWQLCHENCESCGGIKPEYDSNNNLISQNCLTCYGDLHFIYGTSDCSNDSILENGYYLDDNDLNYHKCDIQCQTCLKYSSSQDPKCTKCNTDLGYYLAYNKPTSKCFNKTTIDNGYILSLVEDPLTGEQIKKWMICYSTCKTCLDYGNELDNKCITCISKYYLIYGTNNCIENNKAKELGYYFNTTYLQFVKCDKACLTCTNGLIGDNTNCIKCNTQEGYYPIKGKGNQRCYSEETIGVGYFLNKFQTPFIWEPCYEYCATCEYKGTEKKMACLSCRNDIINKEYNKTLYLKLSFGNCKISCPDNLFLTKEFSCLKSCLNETYEYIPNVTCVDTCPENYVINPERTACVFSAFEGSTSPTEFRDIIFSNISSFVDSDKVINGSNFKAQIISSNDIDPIEQVKNGISGLDFGDCIQTLKDKYNIPRSEDLIIIEIETKEEKEKNINKDYSKDCIDLGKNVKVSICDKNGNILDMSLCSNEITVMKYVGDLEEINLNSAMDYAEQGIDVFNAQDSFFNDKCHFIKSDQDVVLSDRREDYFQNVSFCDEGCYYTGMDYNYMIAKCACDAGSIQDGNVNIDDLKEDEKKGITLNDLANSFTSDLLDFNFDIIKCYNLVFNLNILKQNFGFFSFIIMISLQIIFVIYFSIKKLKPIKNYMIVFEPFDPRVDPPNPPKRNNTLRFKSLSKKTNIYNLLNPTNINRTLSKKEIEIKKTELINHLLNKSKSKKKNNLEEDNDDALVIHYENIDDSSEIKSEDKNNNQKDSSYFIDESKSSDFNQNYTYYKNKEKSLTNYLNNTRQSKKYYDEENNKDFYLYNKNINLKKEKSDSNGLITINFNRNYKENNKLKNKLSRETILPLESNEDINITYGKSLKTLKKYKISNNIKEKSIEIDTKKLESDHENNKEIKGNKKIKGNLRNSYKKTLKNTLKNKNRNRHVNIVTTTNDFISKDKMNNLRESNSAKHYRKNKLYKNIKTNSSKTVKDLYNPEETKKTESEFNTKDLGNMRLKHKKMYYSHSREELNGMNFNDALINDNRTFCLIYVGYLLEEHIILNTFFTDLYLELRPIKMSFLLFGIEINFFFNALFYSESYISDIYQSDGVLDFFSSLPKSIYSFIVTLIISALLKMLSTSKKELMKIIDEKQNKEEYLAAVDIVLKKLMNKLKWFYIIVFFLGLFFCYYCSAFCAVYPNSQKYWLIGSLISILFELATPFIICLFLAIYRYIGLKKRIKCLYNFAQYIGIIL